MAILNCDRVRTLTAAILEMRCSKILAQTAAAVITSGCSSCRDKNPSRYEHAEAWTTNKANNFDYEAVNSIPIGLGGASVRRESEFTRSHTGFEDHCPQWLQGRVAA